LSLVVVDASIALAWCFPDETSDYADGVLVALEGKTMLVPSVWSLEIANAILTGERRKRLNPPEIKQFTMLLENLAIVQDTRPVSGHITDVLPLARTHGLSAYDAAYLELSIRRGAPLATLDDKLRKAAKQAGLNIFAGQPDFHPTRYPKQQ
jgi:predicted nucleic acid-binding protein